MKKFKIGEEVKFAESFTIQSIALKEKKIVKPKDKNFIDKNAHLNILSGECRDGKIILPDVKVEGYDFDNIVELLVKRLEYFNIVEELDSEDAIRENIKASLTDIVDKINEVGISKVSIPSISGYIIYKLDEEFGLNGIMDDLEVKSEDVIDELEDLLQNIF